MAAQAPGAEVAELLESGVQPRTGAHVKLHRLGRTYRVSGGTQRGTSQTFGLEYQARMEFEARIGVGAWMRDLGTEV